MRSVVVLQGTIGAGYPTVDLVCHEVNQGKGGAVMTGLRRAIIDHNDR